MAKMSVREKQFRNNLDWILGGYENGRFDEPDVYVDMTEDEWIEYVMCDIYHIKSNGRGFCAFGDNICRDLRFLGNEYMKKVILEEVYKEGWVCNA